MNDEHIGPLPGSVSIWDKILLYLTPCGVYREIIEKLKGCQSVILNEVPVHRSSLSAGWKGSIHAMEILKR